MRRPRPDRLKPLAVLHYQFESIHPFYDGSGRTGRILNLFHLVLHGLLDLPKIYSQDLLNNLFRHPYTRIEYIERNLGVSRPTASKYPGALEAAGFVRKTKLGRTNFYINETLFNLLRR